jgi:hypothetical protein
MVIPGNRVAADDSSEDLMTNGMYSENVTTDSIDAGSNSTLLSNAKSGNVVPYFKMSEVTASGVRSSGSQIAINQDATLTFVIKPQSFSTSAFKQSWRNSFNYFTLVLSTDTANKWMDFNTDGVTVSDGTGTSPVAAGQSYIPIGGSSPISNTNNTVTVKRAITITVDVKKAMAALDVTSLKRLRVSEQFNNTEATTGGSTYIKTQTGTLNFAIDLKPTVANIFMFPEPITVDGETYTGIATGTGTLAGDQIHWSIKGDATADDKTIPEKVPDSKKWVWIIPKSAGIGNGDTLSVLETGSNSDTSTTDSDGIEQNSQYLDQSKGKELIAKLIDLIQQYKSGSGDATELTQDINDTLNEINTEVETQKQLEKDAGGYAITFKDQRDFLFANKAHATSLAGDTAGTVQTAGTYALQAPTDNVTANLVSEKDNAAMPSDLADAMTWKAYKHDTTTEIDQKGSGLVSLDPTSGGTCKVTLDPNTTTDDVSSIDLVATTPDDAALHVVVKQTIQVTALALTPDDPYDVGTDTSAAIKFVTFPETLASGDNNNQPAYTGESVSALSGVVAKHIMSAEGVETYMSLGAITYRNYGDKYQMKIHYHDQDIYSNIVMVQVTGDQVPQIDLLPSDLTFTNQGTAPRLDQIINGTFQTANQPLTATGGTPFAFSSYMGSGEHWTISAQVSPFQSQTGTLTGDSGGGSVHLKFKFKPTTSLAGSGILASAEDNDKFLVAAHTVSDDNSLVTLFGSTTTKEGFSLEGNLAAEMTLDPAPAAQATNYHSTITWTAGENTAVPAAK